MLGLGQSISIPTKFLDVLLQAQLGIRDRRERMALGDNIMLKREKAGN